MSGLRAVGLMVGKDLLLELRTRELVAAMGVFALLAAVVFTFAFSPSPAQAVGVTPGMLWVTLAFASILGLSRTFVLEREDRCLEALRLFPFDPALIYVAKAISTLLTLLAVEALVVPALIVFSGVPLGRAAGPLVLILVLGSVGLVVAGTLFSAMSVNTRMREVLLPILLLPVASPVLISAAGATARLLAGRPFVDALPGIRLLVAFDAVIAVVGYLVFEYVLEE